MLNIIAGDLKYWFAVVHWFWSGTVDCMKWSEVYREVSAYIANPSKFQPDELRLAQRHTRLLDRGHVWEGSISAVPCLTNIYLLKMATKSKMQGPNSLLVQCHSSSLRLGSQATHMHVTTWTGNGQLLLKYSCKNSEAAKKPWRGGE